MTHPPLTALLALRGTMPSAQPRHWRHRCASGWRLAMQTSLVAACAGADPSQAPTSVHQAWVKVEALVGTPRCRADSDCRSIGVGARACGGPETFLAWSTQATDGAALTAAVARHATLRQAADAKAGVASTCVVAEEPAVHCRKAVGQAWGVCVAAPVTSGPSGSSTQR